MNAVATALKDFFSKRLPPLFSKDIIKELEEIAGKLLKLFNKAQIWGKPINRGVRKGSIYAVFENIG